VLRDGHLQQVPAAELVPGDIVELTGECHEKVGNILIYHDIIQYPLYIYTPQVTHKTHVTNVTFSSNVVTCGMLMAACLLSWCRATLWSSQVRCYKTVSNIT
jgi:hypothetical protein